MTEPKRSHLASGTTLATFELQVKEHYLDREGRDCYRASYFVVESLGKSVEKTLDIVRVGGRVVIEGYLRSDKNGQDDKRIKVRVFSIYEDRSNEANSYKSGLRFALQTFANNGNEEARRIINELLEKT